MSTYSIQLKHSWAGSDKNYSAEEKAAEKKYNHEYYMKNKEKWGIKMQGYTKGDSDFDGEANYDEKNRIGDSDFFAFKNKDGNWVITEEDTKWVLPKGVEPDDEMKKQLSAFKGFQDPSIKTHDDWDEAVNSIINKGKKESDGNAEFDVDSAAKDVIRGKYKNGAERKAELGEDYKSVQKRVNELLKKDKSSTDKKSVEHSDKNLYLIHHGIPGQKWGVRRFQNSDGSLTSSGKKHYKTDLDYQISTTSTKNNPASKMSAGKVSSTANNINSASRNASNINNSVSRLRNNNQNKISNEEIKNMSNDELQRRVKRLNMEKQYRDLTGTSRVLRGQDYVKEALEITGSVAGIAGSAVAIYVALKK